MHRGVQAECGQAHRVGGRGRGAQQEAALAMWEAWERGVPIATENLVGYFVCAGRNAVIDLLRGQRSHSHRYVLGDEDSVTDDRAAPEDPDLRIDLVRWERAIPPRLRRFVRWRLDGIGAGYSRQYAWKLRRDLRRSWEGFCRHDEEVASEGKAA